MISLEGKNALITGGASGIGKAITKELARCKANVLIHYYSSEKEAYQLKEEIEKDSIKAYVFQADLTKEDEIKRLIGFAEEKFERLDILINNSGDMIKRVPFEEITLDYINKVFAINFNSCLLVTKEAFPLLKKNKNGATVVNLSSLAGRDGGGKGALVYACTKGAIITLTKGLAKEFAPYKIRVNCVAPGLILGSRFHETHTPKEIQQKIISNIPLQQAGSCEDVARAVVFLASETNGFITGSCLDINGGVY